MQVLLTKNQLPDGDKDLPLLDTDASSQHQPQSQHQHRSPLHTISLLLNVVACHCVVLFEWPSSMVRDVVLCCCQVDVAMLPAGMAMALRRSQWPAHLDAASLWSSR